MGLPQASLTPVQGVGTLQGMQERRFVRIFLIGPSLLVLYFVYRIFEPFLMPLFLAVIFSCLTFPAFLWMEQRLGGRPVLAALATCLGITLVIGVPFVGLLFMLASEASQAYQQIQDFLDAGQVQQMLDVRQQPYLGWVVTQLDQYVDLGQIDILGSMGSFLESVSLGALRQSSAVVSGVAHLFTSFLIMIFTMFFLFRDGHKLVAQVREWSPLSEDYESRIVEKFQEVSTATVFGSLLTAIAQGVAGGLSFFIVGIPNVLFWGSMTALFSLVPLVGTAVVWLPWALYLFASGSSGRGIALVALSIVLVGGIDNLVRPLLIEGRTRMHTMLVFLSIMGGISYFGIAGMIVGPIMVALGLTFLELYRIEFQEELEKPSAR